MSAKQIWLEIRWYIVSLAILYLLLLIGTIVALVYTHKYKSYLLGQYFISGIEIECVIIVIVVFFVGVKTIIEKVIEP